MTSRVTCSGSADKSTIIAFCPPVSATNGIIGPSRSARVRLIMRAVSVEPVKTTRDQRMRGQASADDPA